MALAQSNLYKQTVPGSAVIFLILSQLYYHSKLFSLYFPGCMAIKHCNHRQFDMQVQ